MTASPPVTNGAARPRVQFADWTIGDPSASAPETQEKAPAPVREFDLVAAAEAAAIRAKADAEAERARVLAQAEADALRTKAEEDARKLRLANDRAERKAAEEQAASQARIAEHNRRRDDADRARQAAARQAEDRQAAEDAAAEEIEAADKKWRSYAIRFAVVCGVVSLPVQMSFFWNPRAPWMAAAPIMLEGAAWVVHRGARAAAVSSRPVWHYRTIVWLLALIAAGVNLYHGLHSFDPGTAVATAFASIAGPGVWDLHEHGRLRKRDGIPTRRERKAAAKTAKAEAKRKAAEDARAAAEKEAARAAAEAARQELRATRRTVFKDVWDEAVKIGAALGKDPDDPAVWPRAYRNIKGTDPGESIESITARRTAEKRVQAALTGTPVNTLSKTTNAQRAAQMPPGPNRVLKTRATRRRGDTPKYVNAARTQAAITAREASASTRPNAN
ncbi:hypothetical protein [Streptomyces sp. NPDC008150]|uniref:hypothetical protein n=1 Tax=Streptomyces sp. NPDC008150 TaxID=3364816 RepID=UPI0036E8D0FD